MCLGEPKKINKINMEIKLPEKHYIQNIDEYNWAFGKYYESKRKNGEIVEKKREIAFSDTLPSILRIAMRKITILAEEVPDAVKILKQMAKVTKEINKLDDTSRNSKK